MSEANLDIEKIVKNKYFVPIVLILIAISISTYFRMQPAHLPMTDNLAEQTVINYQKSQIMASINEQYPNLPQANKVEIMNNVLANLSKQDMDIAIQQVSNQFKEHFKDENGDVYLLAIDPYLWWHYAKNFVKYGEAGDKNINGTTYDTLRNGRFDREEGLRLHSLILFYQYNFLNIFSNLSLMKSIFLFPVIFIALSLIPAFFLTTRIFKDKTTAHLSGFIAMLYIAINAMLMSRTLGGFSDTDTYNILCPLFILWFLISAFYTQTTWKRYLFVILAGLNVTVYQMSWGGWWYIFNFLLATLGIYFVYCLVLKKYTEAKSTFWISAVFFFTYIITALPRGIRKTFWFLQGPLNVISMKSVAETTIWPNVLTTVAEFGTRSFDFFYANVGGALFILISIIGIGYTFKKDIKYTILLIMWYIGSMYAYTKGTRFTILIIPAFAIALGIGFGVLFKVAMKLLKSINMDKNYAKIIIICIFFLLFLSPMKEADSAVQIPPSMNDAWYDSLIGIKEDCDDGIITSWWDFGHWFMAIAERKVTFDGGDQGKRIHWVGKTLLTPDETEAIRILRMLNCGQNEAYETLVKSGMTEKQAIDMVYSLLKSGAEFCEEGVEPLPQYFIASSDMVGKAGVWAHFGGWEFSRAEMWNEVRKGNTMGVNENIVDEIINTPADQWIAPWPTYGGNREYYTQNNTFFLSDGVEIYSNITTNTDQVKYISFIQNGTFIQKEVNPDGKFSILLTPEKGIWYCNNDLAGSMFTRMFFYDAVGLEHFELLSYKKSILNEEIYVYRVKL